MRAESPMTSIAQGKRSDTLGEPKRHATPCKGKSTSNTLCFNAFAPAWRKLHGTLHPGYSCLVQRQSRAATGLRTSGPPSFHGCNMRRFPHSPSRQLPKPVRRNASNHKKQGLEPPPPKRKVFVKPNEQNRACSGYAMARKRAMKRKVFVKPNGQSESCSSNAMARKRALKWNILCV